MTLDENINRANEDTWSSERFSYAYSHVCKFFWSFIAAIITSAIYLSAERFDIIEDERDTFLGRVFFSSLSNTGALET